jgi:hypothetical protein
MLPLRKLSEIFTSAQLNKSFNNALVEGPTDHMILRSFCEGARLSVLIYPVPDVEIDCVAGGGQGGNKGALVRVSEFASSKGQRRLFCIIDRDDSEFEGFQINSHCFITDLSCLEMYALDCDELYEYLRRYFQLKCSRDDFMTVITTARKASWLFWKRIAHIEAVSLANIDGSLAVENNVMSIDLLDWIQRSKSKGGPPPAWEKLGAEATNYVEPSVDPRMAISIHKLDDILRFWLRQIAKVSLAPGWVEHHLRGLAAYDRLSKFDFFGAIRERCIDELR